MFASPYLPLGLGSPQDNGTWATIAYFYPALVVLWGLWKSHGVIGWTVMGIHGVNTAVFTGIAFLLDESFQGSSIESSAWLEFFWQPIAMMPVAVTGLPLLLNFWWLVLFVLFWRWDRSLPPLVETRKDNRPMPGHGFRSWLTRKQQHLLLLASAVVCVILGVLLTIWFALLFMENHEVALARVVAGTHWLTWPVPALLTLHPVFHMVSVTVMGLLLMLGLVGRRSDVVETACWLLLPGQLFTLLLLPLPLLAVVGTLAILMLGLLVQWHYGFPMALLRTRRSRPLSPVVAR